MRPSNLLKTLVVADLLGESDLRRLSFDKLIWDFSLAISSSNSNGLAEVSFDLFKELVDHPHLRVSSEIDVYQAISDWSVSYTIFREVGSLTNKKSGLLLFEELGKNMMKTR